jgi:hypothetical protein
MCAGNNGKLLILHIKKFGKCATGGSDFVHFVLFVAAFGADVFLFFHIGFYLREIQKRNNYFINPPLHPSKEGN